MAFSLPCKSTQSYIAVLWWAHTIGLSVSENLLHIKLEDNLISLSYHIIFISSDYTINKIRFITDYRSLDRFSGLPGEISNIFDISLGMPDYPESHSGGQRVAL